MGNLHLDLRPDARGRFAVTTTGPHGWICCRRLSLQQWLRLLRRLRGRARFGGFVSDILTLTY